MKYIERDHISVLETFHRSMNGLVEQVFMTFCVDSSEAAVIKLIPSLVKLVGWPASIVGEEPSIGTKVAFEHNVMILYGLSCRS